MKLIDKDALVAEIKKLKWQLLRGACSSQISMQTRCKEESYDEVLSFLDTIEVKDVEKPTASDRGMVEEIIINLKRVEQDYRIDLTKEMEWLRKKVKIAKI